MKNKLRKIVLASTLAVAMGVTGILGIANLGAQKVYAAHTVTSQNLASNVVTGGGGTANYVTGDAQSGTGKLFNGVKLTGGAGATFNLGTIDISKSYWNGPDFSFTESEETVRQLYEDAGYTVDPKGTYKADGEKDDPYWDYDWHSEYGVNGGEANTMFKSFISLEFDPTGTDEELKSLYIILEDETGEKLTIEVANVNNADWSGLRAKAGKQTTIGALRRYKAGAQLAGATQSLFNRKGRQYYPVSFCYTQDFTSTTANPKLHSPNATGLSSYDGLYFHWLVRDFNNPNNAYGDSKWTGFKSKNVNVSVQFNTLKTVTSTSVIVTSLGGVNYQDTNLVNNGSMQVDETSLNASLYAGDAEKVVLGQSVDFHAPIMSNGLINVYDANYALNVKYNGKVISTHEFDSATNLTTTPVTFNAGYGKYELIYVNKTTSEEFPVKKYVDCAFNDGSKIVSGGTATFGTKTAVQTNASFTGLVLTGGANQTFKFNKTLDLSSLKWNSNTDYTSLLDFAITPTGEKHLQYERKDIGNVNVDYVAADMSSLTFKLKEVDDKGEETGNYFVIYYGKSETTEDPKNDPKSMISSWVYSKEEGAEQLHGAHRLVQSKVEDALRFMPNGTPKATGFTGNAKETTSLVFANDTVYDTKPYSVTGASYEVRNFNKTYNYGSKSTYNYSFDYSTFKLEISFGSFATDEKIAADYYGGSGNVDYVYTNGTAPTQTSIVITSLLGIDLAGGYSVTEETPVYAAQLVNTVPNEEVNFSDKLTVDYQLAKVVETPKKVVISKESEEDVTLTDNLVYAFTTAGEYTVKYYNDLTSNVEVATSSVIVSDLLLKVNAEKIDGGKIMYSDVEDGEYVEILEDAVISKDGFIKLVPSYTARTGVEFDEVRAFTLNGNTYDNVLNDKGEVVKGVKNIKTDNEEVTPIVANTAYAIESLRDGAKLDFSEVYFDTAANIYIKDSKKLDGVVEETEYEDGIYQTAIWYKAGEYSFKTYEKSVMGSKTDYRDIDDNTRELVYGFGRSKDLTFAKESIWVPAKDSNGHPIINDKVAIKAYDFEADYTAGAGDLEVVKKDNYFEILYLEVKVEAQIKFGATNADSMLRTVVKFKEEDVTLINKYNKSKTLSTALLTGFISTVKHLNKTPETIGNLDVTNWMTPKTNWVPSATVKNNLGLVCSSYTSDSGVEFTQATNEPSFIEIRQNNEAYWKQTNISRQEGYLTYAYEIANITPQNMGEDFVIHFGMAGQTMSGGKTMNANKPLIVNVKQLLNEKLTSVCSATQKVGFEQAMYVYENGALKYTVYTALSPEQFIWAMGKVEYGNRYVYSTKPL